MRHISAELLVNTNHKQKKVWAIFSGGFTFPISRTHVILKKTLACRIRPVGRRLPILGLSDDI